MLAVLAACILQSPPAGEPLADLLKRIPQVTLSRDLGISAEQQELAKKFQAYEARAIPELLPLLEDPDEIVREFVGYVLRDIHGLEEGHLDALIRAHRSGNGWIPPAIAHVGTRKAIAFLVEDLQAHPETQTQVTWALLGLGERGALALAESFRGSAPLDEHYADCVRSVFEEMHERAAPACRPLLEVALGEQFGTTNRKLAIQAIGGLGLMAGDAIPALKELAESQSETFAASVESAILGIGSPEAARILARQLGGGWDVLTLRELAALGENGLTAGPDVLADLAATNPDTRVAAARTLGCIGYTAAVEALVRESSQSDDWELAYAAVEALGRLRANSAVPALRWLAADYWYPPVRSVAKKSLRIIGGTSASLASWHRNNFAFELFKGPDAERAGVASVHAPPRAIEPDKLAARELAELSYLVEQEDYETKRTVHTQMRPGCGLRVPGGVLLGATRGEWGGEIVYLGADGKQQKLLDENAIALHRTPAGIVAVTGLAHMSSNEGVLYRIEPAPDGSYKAAWWKRLPGEPRLSGVLEDGSLFVRCLGGDIVVTNDGGVRMASPP